MNKVIWVFLFCLVGFVSVGQTKTQTGNTDVKIEKRKSNFMVLDGELVWRHLFDKQVSIEDFLLFLKIKASTENVEVKDSLIVGKLRRRQLNFNGFKDGLLTSEIAPYLKLNDVAGDVKIELKNNRYRVTVYNIVLIAEKTAAFWQQNEVDKLEMYYYRPFSKKKYLSDNFIEYSEPVFNKNFMDMFEYKVTKSDF